jgi:hypothetical protein
MQSPAENEITVNFIKKKVMYTFNKLFIEFLKDVKSRDKQLSHTIKKNYKSIDKLSEDYINEWNAAWPLDSDVWKSNEIVLNVEGVSDKNVFRSMSVETMKTHIKDEEREVVAKYMYMLHLFNYLYQDVCVENFAEVDGVFVKVLECIREMNNGESGKVAFILQNIVDEDIKSLLDRIMSLKGVVQTGVSGDQSSSQQTSKQEGVEGMLDNDFFETSKIGQLAKEISSQIDLSSLNISNPEDMLNINKLMGSGEHSLGNIIQQVGSSITQKIQSGEIKQEELIADALSLVGKINNSDDKNGMGGLLGSMMKMMGGGAGGLADLAKGFGGASKKKKSGSSARDRLKAKLNKRKEATAASAPAPSSSSEQ